MTLVNARAALRQRYENAVTTADSSVTVVFDNMPFTVPGKTKKYVLVTINFDSATIQAHGAAVDQYLERCNAAFLRQGIRAVLFCD